MARSLWHALWVWGVLTLPAIAVPVCDAAYIPVAEQPLNSMLYRIYDCEGHVSYVLGTMHSSDPAIIRTANNALPFLKEANIAWFEILSDPANEMAAAQHMLLAPTAPKGLRDMLGDSDFAALTRIFTEKMPEFPVKFLDRYKPWAAAILLQTIDIDMSGVVLDDYLQKQAVGARIKVKALENVKEQLGIFARLSQREQVAMLRESIEGAQENTQQSQQMVEHYKGGELRLLAEIARQSFAAMQDSNVSRKLEKWLVDDRNRAMVQRLLPSLQRGGAFVAVGALHLPGDAGLLQLLESKNYRVQAVHP